MEYLEMLNYGIVDNILSFPTDIYTLSYDQQFKSYGFWNLTELLKFDSRQNGVTWVIRSLDHLRNGNPINTENQSHMYFFKFPVHPYMTYSGKQNQSYSDLKVGSKRRIQQQNENRFGSGGRIRFRSRIELRNN
jgi:hypothetical protein